MVDFLCFFAVIHHNITVVIDAAGLSEVQLNRWVLAMEIIVVTLVQAPPDVVAEDGYPYTGSRVFSSTSVFSPI